MNHVEAARCRALSVHTAREVSFGGREVLEELPLIPNPPSEAVPQGRIDVGDSPHESLAALSIPFGEHPSEDAYRPQKILLGNARPVQYLHNDAGSNDVQPPHNVGSRHVGGSGLRGITCFGKLRVIRLPREGIHRTPLTGRGGHDASAGSDRSHADRACFGRAPTHVLMLAPRARAPGRLRGVTSRLADGRHPLTFKQERRRDLPQQV